MRVLIVEDEDPKRQLVERFCKAAFAELSIEHARSVRSAIDRLRHPTIDLVLLDMSLPTFDIAADDGGGRPQPTGGIEVVRVLEMMERSVPVLIVTAYATVIIQGKQLSLSELDSLMLADHEQLYRGMVYFNSTFDGWEADLEAKMRALGAV